MEHVHVNKTLTSVNKRVGWRVYWELLSLQPVQQNRNGTRVNKMFSNRKINICVCWEAPTCLTDRTGCLFLSVLIGPWWAGLRSCTALWAEVSQRTWQSCSHSLTRRAPIAYQSDKRHNTVWKDGHKVGAEQRIYLTQCMDWPWLQGPVGALSPAPLQ